MAAVAVPVIGGTLDREHVIVGARYLAAQVQRARLESIQRAWLDEHARGVSLRINQAIRDVSETADLEAGDDPVRIGQTSLVSFSPEGGSTSGRLYVAGRTGPQMAIRRCRHRRGHRG